MTASVSVGRAGPARARIPLHAEPPVGSAPLTTRSRSSRFFPLSTLVALIIALGVFGLSSASSAAQAATATPGASPTAMVIPAPDAPRLVLEFQELNDSGVSGTATLYDAGTQTIVVLDLEDTGENHPAHIHAGTCDNLQPEPEYPLQNVGRNGQSTSIVNAALNDLIDGDFAIDLHLAPNELGTLIVCADIEGEPEVPTATGTPAATPAGTPAAPPTPATETPDPTAEATEVPTEEAPETAEPADATQPANGIGGTEPTARPTEEATEVAETPEATEPAVEPTPNEVPTEEATEPADGTGGAVNDAEGSASVALATTGDLDVTGTAVLTRLDDDRTRISVVLSGDAVTEGNIVHLHDGTCDAPGDMTLDLEPINEDGISETDVDIPFDELLTDDYFINVHQSEAAYETWLVCGELTEATVGMVVPEVAPKTDVGGQVVDQTPVAEEETPIAEATTAPEAETPITRATTPPEAETPVAGTTIVTTPEPTAVPTAVPANVAGDGTSGDVADTGKGTAVDPTTGLPVTTGTGPLLRGGESSTGVAVWVSSALAFLSLVGALWLRRADSRRSTTRPFPRWTRPGI